MNQCASYENQIYQVTSMFPNYEPAYSILTILPYGFFYAINNIANGLNTAEMGIDIQFSTIVGYYECVNGTTLHLSGFAYAYKSQNIAVMTTRDRSFLHEYYLYFPSNDSSKCTGQVSYTFFKLGTSPIDPQNQPIFSGLVANLTCSMMNGRNYVWPTIN
ncbi:unnamed protein product [Adineta steineri]|uniref:Uncharacterized protein n=1 Tax=Adineta steineri TaxID=433720 RepID=A0A819HIM5_9BILA|nr:unnamed protein product [Adineta steineri]CAF3897518.1 unnamed protein product [Adineta steineri]